MCERDAALSLCMNSYFNQTEECSTDLQEINHVLLNGQITMIRKSEDGRGATIALMVVQRPVKKAGNRSGDVARSTVIVVVRREQLMQAIEEIDAAPGDMLEVSGQFRTTRTMRNFKCKECGAVTPYPEFSTYIEADCIRAEEIHPKSTEIVSISDAERRGSKEQVWDVLNSKKSSPGKIIKIESLGKNDDGTSSVRLTVREPIRDTESLARLMQLNEISDQIYIMGTVCSTPVYTEDRKNGKVCTYQIDTLCRQYEEDNDPETIDFPLIRSAGAQAEKDRDALIRGSWVFVEGTIQNTSASRTCHECGAANRISSAHNRIFPYYVEYLSNCILPDNEELEEEWEEAPDFESEEDEEEWQ